jgi:hypothetical protein
VTGAVQVNPTIYVFHKKREPPRKYYSDGEREELVAEKGLDELEGPTAGGNKLWYLLRVMM